MRVTSTEKRTSSPWSFGGPYIGSITCCVCEDGVVGSVDVVLLDMNPSSSFSNDSDGETVAVVGCEAVLRLKILNIPALVNDNGAAGSPLLSTCLQGHSISTPFHEGFFFGGGLGQTNPV